MLTKIENSYTIRILKWDDSVDNAPLWAFVACKKGEKVPNFTKENKFFFTLYIIAYFHLLQGVVGDWVEFEDLFPPSARKMLPLQAQTVDGRGRFLH